VKLREPARPSAQQFIGLPREISATLPEDYVHILHWHRVLYISFESDAGASIISKCLRPKRTVDNWGSGTNDNEKAFWEGLVGLEYTGRSALKISFVQVTGSAGQRLSVGERIK